MTRQPWLFLALFLLVPIVGRVQAEDASPSMLKAAAPPHPRIHGPSVFGVRPGSPLLYTIPATGERPMQFSVDELPAGS